jgi:signal peptidase I
LTSTDNPPATDVTDPLATPPEGRRARRPRRRLVIEWFVILVAAVAVSLLLRTFVFQTFYIPSGSMNPTFWQGDRIIVNKLSVELGHINIGDIIVFKAPPAVRQHCADADADLVKRVIGIPGDHLTSKGNTIYVNGRRLNERWSHWEPLSGAIGNVTVPSGQYFVMGDNHANSCDSRMWGTVPRSDIIGKVFLVIWSPSHIRWI